MNGVDLLGLKPDTDGKRIATERSQCSIEKAAPITKPEASCIEADQRRYDDVRNRFLALRRHWDIPDSTFKPIAHFP